MPRYIFWMTFSFLFVVFGLSRAFLWKEADYFLFVTGIFFIVGVYDILQKGHNVLRNYPVIGHFRFLMLKIRPEIQQYYIETEQSGRPFNAETRSLIDRRSEYRYTLRTMGSKRYTVPFGTQLDVYEPGYEWINHSLKPSNVPLSEARVMVGGADCLQPYLASRFNISAMSYGAISKPAIRALNRGAKEGDFAHNTGEGGLSPYHLEEGGDIIWQIGTANFGCRQKDGRFCPETFQERAQHPSVKMIEVKLSQGAKPGHGGVLPAAKITEEIAEIRGIPMGQDCESPPANPNFSTPKELLSFIATLRDLSGGKPVGFKLCLGSPSEFMCICKAMLETKIYPDFITVDGGEGGTGAAPPEFSDSIGTPLFDALAFVRFCLVGAGLRKHIRLIASGKITSAITMAKAIALGADMCNSARGMMFALGCIQSRNCNNNLCPTGITTQDPKRTYALNVADKAPRVTSFHAMMIHSFLLVLGAAGVATVDEMTPAHICRRTSIKEFHTYASIYPHCSEGDLLTGSTTDIFGRLWVSASADCYVSAKDIIV